MPLDELLARADSVRRKSAAGRIELCSIINAKSGSCGENCKFCAQSAHYFTDIEEYPLKRGEEIVSAALKAEKIGARRFGIVTSGNRLTREEISIIADAIREIKKVSGILPCASLGALDEESFGILAEAGLSRYHHNIETSRRFYSSIVSTHDHDQRTDTVKRAKKAGLEVCSGGIIGMGETWQDRVEMALLLKELDVDSIPLNFLVPIKGTPLEKTPAISPHDAIRVVALFRTILEDKMIKVAAGRESVLKDFQEMIFAAGANGMMIGGYLTRPGRPVSEDLELVSKIQGSWNEE